MPKLRSAALAVKSNDPYSSGLGRDITDWLTARGVQVSLPGPENDPAPAGTDLALSVGGDGSMISAARRLAGRNIPLIGVNTGRVGFLPELEPNNWREGLALALDKRWSLEKRLAVAFVIHRAGQDPFSGLAVNELVITRSGLSRLPAYELAAYEPAAGASKFITLRADGLIAASPTGSTAYSGSAGGPLLHPSVKAYAVTAICPFQTRMPPLVLGARTPLEITLRESSGECYAVADGQEFFPLREGDRLTLRGQEDAIILARLGIYGYFDKLRSTFMADSPGMPRP
ncbi:MAG: NAD(+)/NADH kinase [Desulfovibrionaceae bacterium]|nr:NAD(+)/NADH kinase [Desulfovibrionaceae bacterium]